MRSPACEGRAFVMRVGRNPVRMPAAMDLMDGLNTSRSCGAWRAPGFYFATIPVPKVAPTRREAFTKAIGCHFFIILHCRTRNGLWSNRITTNGGWIGKTPIYGLEIAQLLYLCETSPQVAWLLRCKNCGIKSAAGFSCDDCHKSVASFAQKTAEKRLKD